MNLHKYLILNWESLHNVIFLINDNYYEFCELRRLIELGQIENFIIKHIITGYTPKGEVLYELY